MIEVKSKDGLSTRCELKAFVYTGAFMGDRTIISTYESPEIIRFAIGDFVEYRGEKFILDYDPSDKKEAEVRRYGNAITYNLTLHSESALELENCDFCDYVLYDNQLHYSSSPKFSFIGTANDLADRIKANLDRLYPGKWTIEVDASVETEDKNIEIENMSCWDAMVLFNKEYGLNFNVTNRHAKIGFPSDSVKHVFHYGYGNGLYKIERNTNSDEAVITRLKAYGSERNLPQDYNRQLTDVMPKKNLMLPGYKDTGIDYIESPNISIYGIRPKTIVFDDIYPSIEGVEIEGIGRIDEIISAEQITKETEEKETFKITIKDIGFDINDYLTTEPATIAIKSGSLIGYEFEIKKVVKLEESGYELTLNKSKRDNWIIPNKDQNLSAGDRFVLLNIRMPEKYVSYAEEKLLNRAKAYLARYDHVTYSYDIGVDEILMARNIPLYESIREGDKLPFYDANLAIDKEIIIQSLIITEGGNVPTYKITLSDQPAASTIDKIWTAINNIKTQGTATGTTVIGGGTSSEQLNRMYLRKDRPDQTDFLLGMNGGATFGTYVGGFLGSGGIFDRDGYIEANGLTLREFLEVPELRFNRIDVVSGELWNSIAFGLIESVDEKNRIVTLKLEDGELSGLHINDFCRGIFHNLTGNATEGGIDAQGFEVLVGFSTAYFTPVEIIDNAHFRYELKPGSTVHPCPFMKFAVYGNATDKKRQASAYSTRTYKRYLVNVDTWTIDPSRNISYQEGDLSNLVINGQTLEGGSVYLNNVYFGGNILTVDGIDSPFKGEDAYSVVLTTYSAVYNVADGVYDQLDVVTGDKNVVTGSDMVVASDFNVSTRIQASKGPEPLRFSETIGEGKYVVTSESKGCTYVITDGLVAVKEVTEDRADIYIHVNCEGVSVYNLEFAIVRVKDGKDGKDYEYIYTRTSSYTAPTAPGTSQTDDYIPSGWTDDPVGPTIGLPYEWVSKRTKRNNIWGNYSDPSLWSRFGEDGTDYEYIYTRTSTNSRPSTPGTSQSDDYIPSGWTDDPIGPSYSLPYEWVSERKKTKGTWGSFSSPSLWAKYSFDGEDGPPGPAGMTGPGLNFRGEYNSNYYYYYTNDIRDVVKRSGYYYAVKNKGTVTPNWSDSEWTRMDSFKNVATDLLFAQEATIASWVFNNGYIRSSNSAVCLCGNTRTDIPLLAAGSVGTSGQGYLNGDINPYAALKLFQSGLISVGEGTYTSNAGIYGGGTTGDSIRFWAGNTFGNRGSAPYRVTQDGNIVGNKCNMTGTFQTQSGGARIYISPNATYGSVFQIYNGNNNLSISIQGPTSSGKSPQISLIDYSGYTPVYNGGISPRGCSFSSSSGGQIGIDMGIDTSGYARMVGNWYSESNAPSGHVYQDNNGYLKVKK